MPIAREDRHRYPPQEQWERLRHVVLERAEYRCECTGECGRGHQARCEEIHLRPTVRGRGHKRVILSVAHRNHLPEDNRLGNLRAMCQGCHLHYDVAHHRQTALERQHRDRTQLRLLDLQPAPRPAPPPPAAPEASPHAVPTRAPGFERLYSVAVLPEAVRVDVVEAITAFGAAERALATARVELGAALARAREHGAHVSDLVELGGLTKPRLYRILADADAGAEADGGPE